MSISETWRISRLCLVTLLLSITLASHQKRSTRQHFYPASIRRPPVTRTLTDVRAVVQPASDSAEIGGAGFRLPRHVHKTSSELKPRVYSLVTATGDSLRVAFGAFRSILALTRYLQMFVVRDKLITSLVARLVGDRFSASAAPCWVRTFAKGR
jgi:hypothetical protein